MRIYHRQIEAFRFVFQTGSATLAGELMGVTQPAVSRLIRDLEAEVGFKLFDRSRGQMTATRNAVELFREVERSFVGLDRISQIALGLRERPGGELKVAATVASCFYLLPNVVERFRDIWPDVRLSLHAAASPEVVDLVSLQHYDIGVAIVPKGVAGFERIPLPVMDAVCILPADHPLASRDVIRPPDLDNVPLLIISDYSTVQSRIMQSLNEAGISVNVTLQSTYSAPICDLVNRGAGVAILEPLTARAYVSATSVIRPFRPQIPVKLEAIHATARPLTKEAEDFISSLKTEFEIAKHQAQ